MRNVVEYSRVNYRTVGKSNLLDLRRKDLSYSSILNIRLYHRLFFNLCLYSFITTKDIRVVIFQILAGSSRHLMVCNWASGNYVKLDRPFILQTEPGVVGVTSSIFGQNFLSGRQIWLTFV